MRSLVFDSLRGMSEFENFPRRNLRDFFCFVILERVILEAKRRGDGSSTGSPPSWYSVEDDVGRLVKSFFKARVAAGAAVVADGLVEGAGCRENPHVAFGARDGRVD